MREGELVGGFQLLQRLGKGGMAEVWRAVRPEAPHAQRALKVLHLEEGPPDDEGPRIRRFMDEAWIGMSLNHPNVVRTFERGVENHHAFIVMELLAGRPLSELSQGSPLPIGAVVEIGRQALSGLRAMHEATSPEGKLLGLVHRDIKPSNLFLTVDGQIKIIDFGISHVAALDQTLTRTGTVRGSLPYCAPEQARSETQTPQSDLFSLGLVLHELLRGERCFPQKTDATILSAILFSVIPPVHLSRAEVPRPLSDLITQMLEKDPTARPATARAAMETLEQIIPSLEHWTTDALAQWLHAQPVQTSTTPHTSTRDVRPLSPGVPSPGPSTPTKPQRKRGVRVIGLVAVAALLTPWIWKKRTAKPAPVPTVTVAEPPGASRSGVVEAPVEASPPPKPALPSKPSRTSRKARAVPAGPPGWLTIGMKDGWAEIAIDGKPLGPTPIFRVELSPGAHWVETTRSNGERQRRRVDVTSGIEAKVAF